MLATVHADGPTWHGAVSYYRWDKSPNCDGQNFYVNNTFEIGRCQTVSVGTAPFAAKSFSVSVSDDNTLTWQQWNDVDCANGPEKQSNFTIEHTLLNCYQIDDSSSAMYVPGGALIKKFVYHDATCSDDGVQLTKWHAFGCYDEGPESVRVDVAINQMKYESAAVTEIEYQTPGCRGVAKKHSKQYQTDMCYKLEDGHLFKAVKYVLTY